MKYLYAKNNEEHIWIPFLSDEENYKLDPLAKPYTPPTTLQQVLNESPNFFDDIQQIILKQFANSFNDFIRNNQSKGNDYLINHILHVLVHNKYLSIIDTQLQYNNYLYRDLTDNIRMTSLKDYILKHGTSIVLKLIKSINNELINYHTDINNLYDTLGTTTQLDEDFDIDVNSRSCCFLYINGTLMISDYGEKHYQLINKYLHNNNIPHTSYVDAGRYRDINDIKKNHNIDLPASTPIAWGHIASCIAYIETYQNVSLTTVVNKLLAYGKFRKIYLYNFNNQTITRLAKLYK